MSEYAQRFADNRIDVSVLPELTDQDLEKLGVILGVCLGNGLNEDFGTDCEFGVSVEHQLTRLRWRA